MDLIYMNANREDIGVLQDYSLDLAFGADENSFECEIKSDNHCCEKNYMLYMEGTEYGGIVDGIGVDTESNAVTYSGRTWHGILASKVILPLMEGEEVKKPTAKLPDGYTKIEYIESTGTQCIDTGFKPNNNTRVVMDFQLTQFTGAWIGLLSARDSKAAGMNNSYSVWIDTSNIYMTAYGANMGVSFGTADTSRKIIDKNKNVTTIGTETVSNGAATFQCGYNLHLLNGNSGGTYGEWAYARIFSCQIYDNGTLVRDYVPCISTSGVVGLYDFVNGVFYGNAGTGVFVAGDVVEEEPDELTFDVELHTQTSSGESNVNRYLVISGDAHECIKYILYRCGLSALFSVPESASGINIKSFQFDRYIDAYKGLRKMLASVDMLLHFSFNGGMVMLSTEPKRDYSKNEEFDSDLIDFDMQKQENKVNHLICLGGGELENRLVKHLYVDAEGKISETQTFFGLDEYTEVYDYANVESEEELLKAGRERLRELHETDSLKVDFEAEDDLYNVGDIVGAVDNVTGISIATEIVKKIVTIKDGRTNISYEVGD